MKLVLLSTLLALVHHCHALEFDRTGMTPPPPNEYPDDGKSHCTAETEEAKRLQPMYDQYCEFYKFTKAGAGNVPECFNIKTQIFTPEEKACAVFDPDLSCSGPLQHLIGTWEGDSGKSYTAVPVHDPTREGINIHTQGLGPVPGLPTQDFHAIKNQSYKEIIVFEPIMGDVRNRGSSRAKQITAQCQSDQFLQGVTYKQAIYQTSPDDIDGSYGGLLHEETGMLLYNARSGDVDNFQVVRMGNIPHGVSLTATGKYERAGATDVKEFLERTINAVNLNITPTKRNLKPLRCLPNTDYSTSRQNWGETADENGKSTGIPQPGVEPYLHLNPWLLNATKKTMAEHELVASDLLEFIQEKGISQTQFIKNQSGVDKFESYLWINEYENKTDGSIFRELQYSQRVQMSFMQRFDCLECKGAIKDDQGCLVGCRGMDDIIYTGMYPDENGILVNVTGSLTDEQMLDGGPVGKSFNEIPFIQHHQCYDCKPKQTKDCLKQPLISWPHIQVNTLRKVSDSYIYGYEKMGGHNGGKPNAGARRRHHH